MRYLPLLLFPVLFECAQAQTNEASAIPGLAPTAAPVPAAAAPAAPSPAPAASTASAAPAPTPAQLTLRDAAQMVRDHNLDGALDKLNTLILSDPRNMNAYVLRGQVYSEKKMPDKEANDFQSAHLLDPTNAVVNFDLAEVKFTQKSYDAARIEFEDLSKDPTSLIGGLSSYKVFLCDLMGNHPDEAAKEFDAFNQVGSGAPYYYANAAWSLVHNQKDDAQGWLDSANHIYSADKNNLYVRSLIDLGLLPSTPANTP